MYAYKKERKKAAPRLTPTTVEPGVVAVQ